MAGPTFSYNNPRINGQTIFVKRGPHCGKLGIVKQQNKDGSYMVSQADFGMSSLALNVKSLSCTATAKSESLSIVSQVKTPMCYK